jgi:hypothetical protein
MTKLIDIYIFKLKVQVWKYYSVKIETNMHYVQFTWLVLPISFQLDVQIGCIFYGFKSQVEFYSFDNLKIYIHANIPNACSII